jgi:hypothetical protein
MERSPAQIASSCQLAVYQRQDFVRAGHNYDRKVMLVCTRFSAVTCLCSSSDNPSVPSAPALDPHRQLQLPAAAAARTSQCGNCSAAAVSYCADVCKSFLCQTCWNTVHALQLFRSHKSSPISFSPASSATVTPVEDSDLDLALAISASLAEQVVSVVGHTTGLVNRGQVCFAIALLLCLYLKSRVRDWVSDFMYALLSILLLIAHC